MTRIELPAPETDGTTSVERAIATRASRRSFTGTPVATADVSQMLWGAQGVTHEREGIEMRAAPSAGATYPLVAFLEVAPNGGEDLDPGLYRYEPTGHALEVRLETAIHDDLTRAALSQELLLEAFEEAETPTLQDGDGLVVSSRSFRWRKSGSSTSIASRSPHGPSGSPT